MDLPTMKKHKTTIAESKVKSKSKRSTFHNNSGLSESRTTKLFSKFSRSVSDISHIKAMTGETNNKREKKNTMESTTEADEFTD